MSGRSEPVSTLKNVGPTIAKRLAAVGITTQAELGRVGPAAAFQLISRLYPNETISVCYYLYSLEGALHGLHWDSIGEERKSRLREQAGLD
jgi:DNA transformation protein